MRIGLHGLAALTPWQSLVAALGEGAEVVALDGARCDAIVVCAGVANGEGAAVLAFARGGGPVLGLGEGFQALCALGMLPGRVSAPREDERELARAHVRVEGRATPFTSAIPAGRVMTFDGVSAVDLRYDIGEPEALESRGQVIFRYCDSAGGPIAPTGLGGEGVDPSRFFPVPSPPSAGERVRVRGRRASPLARPALTLTLSRGRERGPDLTSQLRLSSVPLVAPKLRARGIAGVCSEAGNVVGVLAAAAAVDAMGAQLLGSLRMHLRGKR